MFNVETKNGFISLDLNNLSINDLKRLTAEANAVRLRRIEEKRNKAIKEIADFIRNKLDEVEGLDSCTFFYDDDSTFDLEDVVKRLTDWL